MFARFFLPALSIFYFGMLAPGRADETLVSNLPSNDGGHGLVSSGTQRAVSFTTSTTSFEVTTATMRLSNYISATDTALLTLRLDDGNMPSSVIYASMIAPESTSDDVGNFVFTVSSGITLNANTKYWLVIAAASDANTFSWFRSDPSVPTTGSGTIGTQEISDDGGVSWSVGSNGPHSFAVNGVPEPTTALLVVLGLAASVLSRHRGANGLRRPSASQFP